MAPEIVSTPLPHLQGRGLWPLWLPAPQTPSQPAHRGRLHCCPGFSWLPLGAANAPHHFPLDAHSCCSPGFPGTATSSLRSLLTQRPLGGPPGPHFGISALHLSCLPLSPLLFSFYIFHHLELSCWFICLLIYCRQSSCLLSPLELSAPRTESTQHRLGMLGVNKCRLSGPHSECLGPRSV